MTGDPAGPDIGSRRPGRACALTTRMPSRSRPPSLSMADLLSARSFAGTLLGRSSPRQQPDLMVTAGWLSSLLAISATDLGDHAAAVVWCTDASGAAAMRLPRTARLGGADPVADRLVPRRPAGSGGRRPARTGSGRPGRPRTSSSPPRRCAAWRCSATAAGMAEARHRPLRPWRSSGRRCPGDRHLLGAAGRRSALHRHIAAARGQVRRGGTDDPRRSSTRPTARSHGPRGPADQLRPYAADPRARRCRARRAG